MHSLSVRVFADIGTGATSKRSPCPEAIGGRRQTIGCRIVACSSPERNAGNGGERQSSGSRQSSISSSSARSFLSRNQTYALLKQQMEVAAKDEVRALSVVLLPPLHSHSAYRFLCIIDMVMNPLEMLINITSID